MKYQAIPAPDWLSRGAVYQINPRTFCREGTLCAVTAALPDLKTMGFETVYLCPIFQADDSQDRSFWSDRQKKYGTENPKNPYRMNDYFTIDEEYGTMEDLRTLIAAAHGLKMHVLLDLVYLHIGPNAPILRQHPEFAQQDAEGRIVNGRWHFPLLDYNCPGLREYLWCNMVYYIGALDADGFRCDVGDGVPLDFWAEGRRRIRAVKPDAVLINEGTNWQYLLEAFDSCYYFDWHEKLYAVFCGDASPRALREMSEDIQAKAPAGALLLRDIDNHDTVTDWPARTEIAAGHDGMEQIEVINYLIDGIPMVYCGNELADAANINMFANRFHMGSYEVTDRQNIGDDGLRRRALMTRLNALKKESNLLRYGRTFWPDHDRPDQVLCFRRETEPEALLFVGNTGREMVTVTLRGDTPAGAVLLENGCTRIAGAAVTLAPHGYLVLTRSEGGNRHAL